MSVIGWFQDRFAKSGKSLRHYKRGMKKAHKHDHQGAIDEYTATIESPQSTFDLKAQALYNRALVYVAAGSAPQGIDDLNRLLAMEQILTNVKTMARQKLARMENQSRVRHA